MDRDSTSIVLDYARQLRVSDSLDNFVRLRPDVRAAYNANRAWLADAGLTQEELNGLGKFAALGAMGRTGKNITHADQAVDLAKMHETDPGYADIVVTLERAGEVALRMRYEDTFSVELDSESVDGIRHTFHHFLEDDPLFPGGVGFGIEFESSAPVRCVSATKVWLLAKLRPYPLADRAFTGAGPGRGTPQNEPPFDPAKKPALYLDPRVHWVWDFRRETKDAP